MTWYTTKDGDTADEIVWRHYKAQPGALAALFDANPLLAFEPPVLAGGLQIALPELASPAPKRPERLWGE